MSPASPSEQQDAAAGARHLRELRLADGRVVTASIELIKIRHQLWGYLRFKNGSATTRIYVGRVTADARDESLRIGWELVRSNRVAEQFGWQWAAKAPKAKR